MPNLEELFQSFGDGAAGTEKLAADTEVGNQSPQFDGRPVAVDLESQRANGGTTKTASEGSSMNSLQDIYMALADQDLEKEAAAAAQVPVGDDEDFAKMAAAIAEAEADEIVDSGAYDEEYAFEGDEPSEGDIIKIASEYDAAGRIMARGFFDEFQKLAGNLDTEVAPNQMTESPSAASTPALGDRGLPTVETNFAGNDAHDQMIETAQSSGVNPKDVYKETLKEPKSGQPGMTSDKPFQVAQSMPGVGGFATMKNINAKPA